MILGSRPVADPPRDEATQPDQGERRIGRLVPVDPEELFRRQRGKESAPSARLVPVDVPRVREEPTIEPATELEEQAVVDRLIAFSLLLAATLPVVSVAYALGLILVRDSNLSWVAKTVGFLLSWQMAGLAALLMAPGQAIADAVPAAVSSGLAGAVLGLLSVAVVGPCPAAAQDGARSSVPAHSEQPSVSRGRFARVASEQHIIAGAAIALIVTLRFPPFILVLDTMTINLGFGFLFDPPTWRNSVPGTVNVPLLLTEWVAIAILAGRHTGARQAVARAATPTRLTGAI